MSTFGFADDIDNNVQGAEAATEQSNRQLAKAAASQKSGNTMVIIITLTSYHAYTQLYHLLLSLNLSARSYAIQYPLYTFTSTHTKKSRSSVDGVLE